ncbi:variant surface glycoprotein 2053 [Anopheles sinensis]|uniref:Variant surface glycoprotein 2053 n=1 Tax=Anopheles sinensis TaxID=74873 RepID=A0A084VGQ5_ANOSI|nr:variant surface glycoprotein 2053 [Anopheles sinensis]
MEYLLYVHYPSATKHSSQQKLNHHDARASRIPSIVDQKDDTIADPSATARTSQRKNVLHGTGASQIPSTVKQGSSNPEKTRSCMFPN